MHAACAAEATYHPAVHAVHVIAPVPVPVFVIEPAAHVIHVPTFDAVEYWPAVQAVHAVAPVLVPVFVFEPAAQSMQPEESWPSDE